MKKYLFALIAFSFLVGASCQQKIDNEKEMKAHSDAQLEVWNTGNLSLYDEILSPEVVLHNADGEDLIGIEAVKGWVTSTRTGFPDVNLTFDELIIKGEYLVVRWTFTGTNTGPFADLPPTGKKVKITGTYISHVVDGKEIEVWQQYNQLAMFTQLGYTLTPPVE